MGLCGGLEPIFQLSGLAHQVDLHLVKLKIGVQEIEITSALLNACVLLLFGCDGRTVGTAIANLDGNNIDLIECQLAFQRDDLCASLELPDGVTDLVTTFKELISCLIGLAKTSSSLGQRLASLGALCVVEDGKRELKSDLEVVVIVKAAFSVVVRVIVKTCQTTVLNPQTDLRDEGPCASLRRRSATWIGL